MSNSQSLIIDVNEEFPCLKRSPLIEAVIHWQAHANKKLEPETLETELTQRLPDYPFIQTQQGFQVQASEKADGTQEVIHQTQWNGFRLQNDSKNRVAQFTPTGVAISRLETYESWETFHQEALRLWSIFQELAEPTTINRLGVRYINKISLEEGESASTYLKTVPHNDFNLSLTRESFFYQDTYNVPNHPYGVNWVCTGQLQVSHRFLIVDIDVFISEVIDLEELKLINHLNKIRWLKNKIFFNSITDIALEKFGG
jgi:uncharacterized protein (TIGR04255 family)